MGSLVVTREHIQNAMEQARMSGVNLRFGGRVWEDTLTRNYYRAWSVVVDALALHSVEASGRIRKMLTLVYGVLVECRKGTLPDVPSITLDSINRRYIEMSEKKQQPPVTLLEADLRESLEAHSGLWSDTFFRALEKCGLSLDERVNTCFLSLMALEAQNRERLEDPFFIDEDAILNSLELEEPNYDTLKVLADDARMSTGVLESAFDDLVGYADIQRRLKAIGNGIVNPTQWARWGAPVTRSVLLNGPVGTGKTALGRALARYIRRPIHERSIANFGSSYVNGTVLNMQKMFDEARKARAVLFLDEADTFLLNRVDTYKEDAKVVAAFNKNMERGQGTDDLVVVLATNFMEHIDRAAIRAGRVDEVIYVPLPNDNDRRAIFDSYVQKAESLADRVLFPPQSAEAIVKATNGMSCADLEQIVSCVLQAKADAESQGQRPGPVMVTEILKAIQLQKTERTRKNVLGAKKPIGFNRD